MSRTQERAGRKSSRRQSRTAARAKRREEQLRFWTQDIQVIPIPENLRRRWQRRGLLGGGL